MSVPALLDVGAKDRRTYLGGSDIAGVLGVSPWATQVSVWQKKVEPPKEETPGPKIKRFNRGKLWEQVVGEMLVAKLEAREHKVQVLSTNHRYADPDVPYFAAEIDYEIRLDDIPGTVNVELKTVHPNAGSEWGEEDTDDCPVHYAAQAMWGLGITRRQCCIVAPLFGADEIRIYPIIADADVIAGMRERAETFWNLYVLPRVAPDPVTLDDVDRLFTKEVEHQVFADPDMVERLLRYRACKAEMAARETEALSLEFAMKRFMGTSTALHLPGQDAPAATWRQRNTSRFDVAAFKEAYPKAYAGFLKKGVARVFQVRDFTPEA